MKWKIYKIWLSLHVKRKMLNQRKWLKVGQCMKSVCEIYKDYVLRYYVKYMKQEKLEIPYSYYVLYLIPIKYGNTG